ncbi:MAG: hypothetical protein ABIW32_04750 [Terrimesophilobacter sp.]
MRTQKVGAITIAVALSLILASCAAAVPRPLVSETSAPSVESVEDLVSMIEGTSGSTCEFDHHNKTKGAIDSASCTLPHGELYLSVFDDIDELNTVASRFTDPGKGFAGLSGPNWLITGVDGVVEGVYNAFGGTLYTDSGRYCMKDGAVEYCV